MKVSIAFRANDDFLQEHVVKKVMVFLFAGAIALSPVRTIAQTYSEKIDFLNLYWHRIAEKYPSRMVDVTDESLIKKGLEYCTAISAGISKEELTKQFLYETMDLPYDEFLYAVSNKAAIDVAAVYAFCPQHKKVLGYD
jgi:hypothetical protein